MDVRLLCSFLMYFTFCIQNHYPPDTVLHLTLRNLELGNGSGNFDAWHRNYGIPHRASRGARVGSGSSFFNIEKSGAQEGETARN
jgi:hypothetical protein